MAKNFFTVSKNIFTAAKNLPTGSKNFHTAGKNIFTAAKNLLTVSKNIFTAAKNLLTVSKNILTVAKNLPTASKNILIVAKNLPTAGKNLPTAYPSLNRHRCKISDFIAVQSAYICAMNPFRTLVKPTNPGFRFSHSNKLMSIGSCFSESLGHKFQEYKFNMTINPFGQQYNPASIAQGIHRLLSPEPYTEDDLGFHNELYFSYEHHGSFSGSDLEAVLTHMNRQLKEGAPAIRQADVLFLTLGTSQVFELKETGKIVSNCHKMPSDIFTKRMLEPAETMHRLSVAIGELLKVNRQVKVIFTVSPVRYFADGAFENSVSKAQLFAAIYEMTEMNSVYTYFPSYEMVIDDLRDYRFYKEDMVHPGSQATEYVWQGLCESLMTDSSRELMKEIEEIRLAAQHRPRNPNSDAHRKFIARTINKIEELHKNYSLDFTKEQEILQNAR